VLHTRSGLRDDNVDLHIQIATSTLRAKIKKLLQQSK
jgi:hypothetical protein